MKDEITKEHRAAIDRLSLRPGECKVDGCGEDLLCVNVEPVDTSRGIKDIPPPRFACPVHEVWLGFCFDEGYPDDAEYKLGLYEATLRDVADPTWHWLPEPMRAAAVVAGFGVRADGDCRFRVGIYEGRAWGSDGRAMLDIGPPSEVEAALDRAGIVVKPGPDALKTYRLPSPERMAPVFAKVVASEAVTLTEPAPDSFAATLTGDTLPGEMVLVAGRAFVASYYVTFVEAVFPGVQWYASGPKDPLFAKDSTGVRAMVMPIFAGERVPQ